MIANDTELTVTSDRIVWFQNQATHMRRTEKNPATYRLMVEGLLAELDRMQLEVREYLASHPAEFADAA